MLIGKNSLQNVDGVRFVHLVYLERITQTMGILDEQNTVLIKIVRSNFINTFYHSMQC